MTTHRRPLSAEKRVRTEGIVAELESTPGVEEVVIALDEGVAYLKVDKWLYSQAG